MDINSKVNMDPVELLALAGNLNSILDLDYLLQRIGDAAEQMLDCEASSIMLMDDSRKFLYFKVVTGEKGSALKKMTVAVGEGIAGWVALNRQSVVVNDARNDPRFAAQYDRQSGFKTRQLLAVPMIARGELIGVAEVLNRRDDRPFAEKDVSVLTSLSNLASIAILNTKLIQDQKNFFSHVLELLGTAIESSRPGFDSHTTHAAYLSCAIAKRLGVEDPEYRYLYYAGLLHDIGYVGLKSRRMVQESGMLTATSQDEAHVAMSVKMLEGINIFQGALPIIKFHHENFDGTGFPDRLSDGQIPLGARILRLVEAMEELRMAAGLTGPALREAALRESKAGSGTRFDPQVVSAFQQLLAEEDHIWEI